MKMVALNFLFNLHIKLLAIRLGWNDSHFIQSQQQKWSQVPRNVSGSKFYHSDFFLRNVNNGDSRSHVKAKKIKRLKRIILLSNISSTKGHKCKGPFSHIFLISHRTFVQVMELFLDLHRNVWRKKYKLHYIHSEHFNSQKNASNLCFCRKICTTFTFCYQCLKFSKLNFYVWQPGIVHIFSEGISILEPFGQLRIWQLR